MARVWFDGLPGVTSWRARQAAKIVHFQELRACGTARAVAAFRSRSRARSGPHPQRAPKSERFNRVSAPSASRAPLQTADVSGLISQMSWVRRGDFDGRAVAAPGAAPAARGAPDGATERPASAHHQRHSVGPAHRRALARPAGALRPGRDGVEPLLPLARLGRVGPGPGGPAGRGRRRVASWTGTCTLWTRPSSALISTPPAPAGPARSGGEAARGRWAAARAASRPSSMCGPRAMAGRSRRC